MRLSKQNNRHPVQSYLEKRLAHCEVNLFQETTLLRIRTHAFLPNIRELFDKKNINDVKVLFGSSEPNLFNFQPRPFLVDSSEVFIGISRKKARQILFSRLLWGCIFTLSGVACEIMLGVVAAVAEEDSLNGDGLCVLGIFGGLFIAVGISFLIVYYVSRFILRLKTYRPGNAPRCFSFIWRDIR